MSNPIEFQLFAPRNQKVALVGSFANWEEIAMQKDEKGYFRTQVDLEDGIYQYQFRIESKTPGLEGKWLEFNDPYMTEMDLESEKGMIRIKEGEKILDTYVWQHDDQPLPQNSELILYEMHLTDFCGKGIDIDQPDKLQQVTEKLDYLSELGINAIALMPTTEYAGNYRWGYLIRYFFALESSYGKPKDFKRFVDECHARGIRVFIDGIFNHTDDQSPLLLIDRDYWYYHDRHYPEDDANYWGPELNYDFYDEQLDLRPAWNFISDVVQFWVREYHIDGIRYDAVRQLNNYEFFRWLFDRVQDIVPNKPFYQIAEHIPDTCEICKPQGVFDGCWHESFRYFLKDALTGENFDLAQLKSAIDAKQQVYTKTTNVINYLATHDREHMIVEMGDRGIFGAAAFQRVQLGAVLQFTAPSIPMLWMGDEFGQATHKTQTTTEPNPLDWSLLDQELNQDLLAFYKKLIALRKEKPALQTNNIDFFYEHSEHKILAFVRWNEAGERVVVIANFSDRTFDQSLIPHFPADGTWQVWNDNHKIAAKNQQLAIDLAGYEAKILLQLP
jgi:1,4-alpha-glucan branching enzyme